MRLIDADELDNVVLKMNEDGADITRGEYKLIDSVLFEFSTVDAMPVVHGHWTNLSISVSGYSSAKCSVCGCIVHDGFSNVINYCPNCGADMRDNKMTVSKKIYELKDIIDALSEKYCENCQQYDCDMCPYSIMGEENEAD